MKPKSMWMMCPSLSRRMFPLCLGAKIYNLLRLLLLIQNKNIMTTNYDPLFIIIIIFIQDHNYKTYY